MSVSRAGHVAFTDEGGVTSVDFNVGKSGRSELKVTGKCKRNARHFESSTTLYRVCANDAFYKVCKMKTLLRRNHHHLPQSRIREKDRDSFALNLVLNLRVLLLC